MGWKTVEISQNDYLRLYLNNLYINREGQKLFVNLNDIDTLVIDNFSASLSLRLINALVKHNVNIIINDYKHMPQALVVAINGNHKSLKVMAAQMQWTSHYKALLWQAIIKNKIANQIKLLKKLKLLNHEDETTLWDYHQKVRPNDISNREGHAAKLYWKLLFGENFQRERQKQDYQFLVNLFLNYGYSVLHAYLARTIIRKGLDPRIAIFHKSFSNFFALASDLVEPFRIIVDEIAYQYRFSDHFSVEIRETILKRFTEKFYYQEPMWFNNLISALVDRIVKGSSWKSVNIWE